MSDQETHWVTKMDPGFEMRGVRADDGGKHLGESGGKLSPEKSEVLSSSEM